MSTASPRLRGLVGGLLGLGGATVGAVAATGLPLGTARVVGPGAAPLILSLILGGLSIALLVETFRGAEQHADASSVEGRPNPQGQRRVLLVLVLLGGFVLLLPYAGFLITGTALMYTLYAVGQDRGLSVSALIAAVATTAAAYFLFVVLLGVRLPGSSFWGF